MTQAVEDARSRLQIALSGGGGCGVSYAGTRQAEAVETLVRAILAEPRAIPGIKDGKEMASFLESVAKGMVQADRRRAK